MAELLWADRAADRLRGWLDEWQARVHVELASPRPVPQPSSGPNEADHHTDDAGGTAGEHGGGLGASEPLPLLGDGPRPVESPREQERKYQRAGLLADLPALADLLRAGRVSTGHVDVLAVALGRVPDDSTRVTVNVRYAPESAWPSICHTARPCADCMMI